MKKNLTLAVILAAHFLPLACQQTVAPISAYAIAQHLLSIPPKSMSYSLILSGSMRSIQFSPNEKKIITTSMINNTPKIWNAKTGQLLITLEGHTNMVKSAQFSSDGTKIVTVSDDHTAKIWNALTGQLLHTLSHEVSVYSAQFSPDGTKIVTTSNDHTAKIWNARTGQLLHTLGHPVQVRSAQFSPDGTKIITTSNDHTARIWDAQTGQLLHAWARPTWMNSAQFSPDGTKIVITSWNTARIWDAQTGQLVHTLLEGHTNMVKSAQFSPNGTKIVTVSNDHTAKIWNTLTGQLLDTLIYNDFIYTAYLLPSRTKVITASPGNNIAKIWDILYYPDTIGTYFSDRTLPLQQQSLLITLDTLSKQNKGKPIKISDLVNPEGSQIGTSQLFYGIPTDVVQALKIHYNINENVINPALPVLKPAKAPQLTLSLKEQPKVPGVISRTEVFRKK